MIIKANYSTIYYTFQPNFVTTENFLQFIIMKIEQKIPTKRDCFIGLTILNYFSVMSVSSSSVISLHSPPFNFSSSGSFPIAVLLRERTVSPCDANMRLI